ncbi:hypothetical protein [Micromonospora sp. NPDC005806]|uniref:hypothetical protein n=1 Tax=Micromonospora sp. NPDC005806 TaxID=3364234 RepID=UPI003686A781
MTDRRRIPIRLRLPRLAADGLALLGGLYAAPVRLELPPPDPTGRTGDAHGPVMVLGFVGTLVALVRAVAPTTARARRTATPLPRAAAVVR